MGKKKKPVVPEGIIPIAENRRARHDYAITDTLEAGLSLRGTEVKSLRDKNVQFSDAYALVKNGEVWLLGLSIAVFKHGNQFNHEPDRTRRLLLKRDEIEWLEKQLAERGKSLVPLKLYFKKGWAKVLLGLGKGKKDIDRREDIKKRDADREMRRAMRRS